MSRGQRSVTTSERLEPMRSNGHDPKTYRKHYSQVQEADLVRACTTGANMVQHGGGASPSTSCCDLVSWSQVASMRLRLKMVHVFVRVLIGGV